MSAVLFVCGACSRTDLSEPQQSAANGGIRPFDASHAFGGADASRTDASGFDASTFDAGGFDASSFDASSFDASSFDASSFDASSFDAGAIDSGWLDAALPDASLPACDDGIACTVDERDASGTCQHVPDDEYCSDTVACTIETCDAQLGCTQVVDANLCPAGDECGEGQCDVIEGCYVEPIDADCDDGIACTIDSCRDDARCEHAPSDELCAEGETCRADCGGGCILDVAPEGYIVAHSDFRLFRVRPDDGHTIDIGDFGATITDIALDDRKRLWGISFDDVFSVDFCTAQLSFVGTVAYNVNGLTWAPDGYLYATSISGSVYRIDTRTGTVTPNGALTPWGSSGDAVVAGDGILLITGTGSPSGDELLRFEVATFNTTALGNTGRYGLYGLSMLGDRLVAGDSSGQLFELDPSTGAATLLSQTIYGIWGAAASPLED